MSTPTPPPPATPTEAQAAATVDAPQDKEFSEATPPPAPEHPEPTVIDTSVGKADGLNRCPSCGSTEIKHQVGSYDLQCNYCRHAWSPVSLEEKHKLGEGIAELKGRVTSSGTSKIADTSTLVTLKCSGCGSEVVVNTEVNLQAVCHWCRQRLSINNQIPNGAVPDGVLPFYITHQQAVQHISAFVAKRRFFASKQFKASFKPENVRGVYLPYLVVDGNVRVRLDGHGEVLKRQYQRGTGNHKTTYYDANEYRVYREFDMIVDDLIVESSSERADIDPKVNTNNIINAVLPFDVKNIVAFDANYIGDFTSEKRDLDLEGVDGRVSDKFLTLGREKARALITHFNRGVRWDAEQLSVHGTRWVSVLLPVWLYSHYEKRQGGESMLHYVAVNARTGQTMGSIPVRKGRLTAVGCASGGLVFMIGIIMVIIGVAAS